MVKCYTLEIFVHFLSSLKGKVLLLKLQKGVDKFHKVFLLICLQRIKLQQQITVPLYQ